MKHLKTALIVLLATGYVFVASGCGEEKNVVDSSKKVGMTDAERKDKRGE